MAQSCEELWQCSSHFAVEADLPRDFGQDARIGRDDLNPGK